MLDHLELRSRDVGAVIRFYCDVLAPLGYALKGDGPVKALGDGGGLDLFVGEGEPSANVHFAFRADTRALVDAAWAAGEAGGHRLDRKPALMPQVHAHYYAGFLRDPDGRLVEFACHVAE